MSIKRETSYGLVKQTDEKKSNLNTNSTCLRSKTHWIRVNIQTQLCKQHNDGKCCASFIAFDLSNQRCLHSYKFREHNHQRKTNKSHLTYQHTLTRPTPFPPLSCPGDSPSDTRHWSVAVAVGWESVWLHPSRGPHIWFWGVHASGCLITGQGMPPVLFWPLALLHEKTTWPHESSGMGVQVITNRYWLQTCGYLSDS